MSLTKYLLTAGSVAIALSLGAGCSGKKVQEESDNASFASIDENAQGDSDSGNAMGLRTINFEYDSYALTPEARSGLDNNADILKGSSTVRVQIEGHCDERGSIQYNLALGEKRAEAVKRYMIDRGVSGDRISTISFGEERPIDPASNERAWAKNRRANFAVTGK